MHERMNELLSDAGIDGAGTHGSGGVGSGENASSEAATVDAIQQVTQEIQILQTTTENNVDSLTANTSALGQDTTSHSSGGSSVTSTIESAASGILGGGGGISGLFGGGLIGGLFSLFSNLFGGGSDQEPALTTYDAPDAQNFQLASTQGNLQDAVYDGYGQPRASSMTELALQGVGSQSSPGSSGGGNSKSDSAGQSSANVTVNVQAMDSRSFLDHSSDIAQAVKEAMLNMHSINDVVSDL